MRCTASPETEWCSRLHTRPAFFIMPCAPSSIRHWPKGLAGNTHPGPSLPHGFVSVTACSGAHPSGYGVNWPSYAGEPSSFGADSHATDSLALVPHQHSTTGLAHFQASGAGSIGNHMNYAKVMPIAVGAADFLRGGAPCGFRSSLIGERAAPGWHSAAPPERGLNAEVTTTETVAFHRCAATTATRAPREASQPWALAFELTAAGLGMSARAQPFHGLNVSVEKSLVAGGWVASGSLLAPGPSGGSAPNPGLELFMHAELGAGLSPTGFWPELNEKTVALGAAAIAKLNGSIGLAIAAPKGQAVAEVKVGFSLKSVAHAKVGVTKTAGISFDEIAAAALREWGGTLGRIAVEDDPSSTPALRERNLFYSVLFHALRKCITPTNTFQRPPIAVFFNIFSKVNAI